MTKQKQVYKCSVCGNIIEVLHAGAGQLVCCEQPMELLVEKNNDEGEEKHIPVIKQENGLTIIDVGSVAHPMEGNHYIEWIELIAGNKTYRQFLSPQDLPRAEFSVSGDDFQARAYCNIHGLWQTK